MGLLGSADGQLLALGVQDDKRHALDPAGAFAGAGLADLFAHLVALEPLDRRVGRGEETRGDGEEREEGEVRVVVQFLEVAVVQARKHSVLEYGATSAGKGVSGVLKTGGPGKTDFCMASIKSRWASTVEPILPPRLKSCVSKNSRGCQCLQSTGLWLG